MVSASLVYPSSLCSGLLSTFILTLILYHFLPSQNECHGDLSPCLVGSSLSSTDSDSGCVLLNTSRKVRCCLSSMSLGHSKLTHRSHNSQHTLGKTHRERTAWSSACGGHTISIYSFMQYVKLMNFEEEVRAHRDLDSFLAQASILLDEMAASLDEVLRRMLHRVAQDSRVAEPACNFEEVMRLLFTDAAPQEVNGERGSHSGWLSWCTMFSACMFWNFFFV